VSDTLPDGERAPAGLGDSAGGERDRHVHRIARSAWFGLLAQAADKLLPVVLVLYLARLLSADAFGIYAFLLAYLAFFQVLSDYSVDAVLIRRLSQGDADRPQILKAGLALKLAIGAGSAIVATLLSGVVSGGRVPHDLALFAALTLPTGIGGAYRAYFRSTLEIRSVFFINAGRGTLLAVTVMTTVMAGGGLRGVFLAMAAVNLASYFTIQTLLRHRVPAGLSWDPQIWRFLLRGAMPLFLNALAMTLSLRIGQILLMSMRGPVEVGLLAAASRVSEAFTIVPEALMITVYPLMAGLYGKGSQALMRTAERSTRYLVAVTGIPVILCAVDSEQVTTLLFGPGFAGAGRLLGVLAFTALLSATGTVILNLLVATHHEGSLYRNTLFFAVLNIALTALLIHEYGDLGAAVALLSTSACSQIALAMWPTTRAYVRPLLLSAGRICLAVVGAVALSRWSGLAPLRATILGLALYVVALGALGVLNSEEIRFVRLLIGSASRARRA
jgi:O-antigen/teichoic acid export membrane protein